MTAVAALLAAALAAEPAAPPRSAAPAPAEGTAPGPIRVERRLLTKDGRFFATAGPGWLARGDYFTSPALSVAVSRYLGERGGPELRLTLFFSRLDAAAREVADATGLVPDAHRPRSLVTAGWRQSVGYGKTLVARSDRVLHFDLQLQAAGGLLFTDRAVAPAVLGGPAVLARLGSRAVAQLDVAVVASFERRVHASFSAGVLATLGMGVWL